MNGTGTADGKAITSYPLWVGNTRVNSLNCGNILGNGTASYDPDTQTLTLDNHDADGYAFAANSWTAPIKIQEMQKCQGLIWT